MMSSEQSGVLMNATCRAREFPFGDDAGESIAWAVERVNNYRPTDAGCAHIQFEGIGITAAFDYARPDQLVAVWVSEAAAASAGGDPVVTALLESLLGPDHGLGRRTPAEPLAISEFSVQDTSAWEALGRLAHLRTMLQRQARPFDGLWAAEAAVWLWDTDRQLEPLVSELARRAAPALDMLPVTLAGVTGHGKTATMDRILSVTAETHRPVEGPYAEARASAELASITERVDEALARVDASAHRPYVGALVGAISGEDPIELPSFRGATSDPIGADQTVTVVIDHSVPFDLIDATRISAELDDDHIDVRLGLLNTQAPTSVVERCLVSILDDAGQLLAGSVSMRAVAGELEAALRLPRWRDQEQKLIAVVSRDPEFWPRRRPLIEQRLRHRYAQDILDAMRVGQSIDWASELPAELRPDLETLVPHDTHVYTAEATADLDVDLALPIDGSDDELAGIRSLAMSWDRFDVAVQAETARLRAGGTPTIQLVELDALMLRASPETAGPLAALVEDFDDLE